MSENKVAEAHLGGKIAVIERWLLKRSESMERQQLATIDPDLDLVDAGLVDSLRIVEFVVLVGQVAGKRIDMNDLDLDRFRTLRRVSDNFLGG